MDTNQVYAVLDQAKIAFEALSTTLREVIGQMRDVQEENSRLHDANGKLTEDYNAMRQRANDLENELFQSRREARDAKSEVDVSRRALEDATKSLSEAQDECRKLREIILNVGALTDAILNPPKAPEVPSAPIVPPVSASYPPAAGQPEDQSYRF